jgi:hypothetical protein|nr:MAG TPA: hypothetical protein [Caudoviricetes sp.]
MFKSTPIKSLPLDRIVIYAFIGICLSLIGIAVNSYLERRIAPPTTNTVTYSDAPALEDTNLLQNTAQLKKSDAATVASTARKIHTGKRKPDASYTYTADAHTITKEQALSETKERIKAKDPHLPPLALKDTDKTLIAPSADNRKPNADGTVNLDVYKINTYRNWELGIGAGVERGNVYIPISLQRNYSRKHSVEAELHLSPEKNMTPTGAELRWKIHFGK